MDSQNEQIRCLCGYSSELCKEKHDNIKNKLSGFKEELIKSESRIKEYIDTSEAHTTERLSYQKEIAKEITNSLNESFKEGLQKFTDGLSNHRLLIEDQDGRLKVIECRLPTNAISRIVKLENWQKKVTYGGIAILALFETFSKWGGKLIEIVKNIGGNTP